ncbi:MAG: LpqB family beta-propeller domain-containing protein [Rudaea sp.]
MRPAITFRIFLFALLSLLASGLAQSTWSASALERLTSTGDVSSFEWAPRSDFLYVTRAGQTAATFAPDVQVVHDLYRISVPDGKSVLLQRDANQPAISPDGTRLVAVALAGEKPAVLEFIDAATGHTTTAGPVDRSNQPGWAGVKAVYTSGGALRTIGFSASVEVHSARLVQKLLGVSPGDGSIAYEASDGLHILSTGSDVLAYAAKGDKRVEQAAWSPDGTRLAFVAAGGPTSEVWVTPRGGSARRILNGEMEYFAGLSWAPDGGALVLSRTPTGSEGVGRSELWRVAADGRGAAALTDNSSEESLPRYSPDGRRLAFLRDGDVYLLALDSAALPLRDPVLAIAATTEEPSVPLIALAPEKPAAQLTPPATIRVRHDALNNNCRNLPDGEITVLDFETYVKRVVPRETPASWQPEALKAQAVAARSYAWFYVIARATGTFDVYDSTRSQYMCDTQDPRTDAAVDATRGQYGDYGGNVIFAAYGANNGDPTLSNTWGNPYLIAVDDPVDFMNAVSGNGIGFSQWGGQRWASPPYDWNYQQILMHYYTGVTVEAPTGGTPDTTKPIGAILTPWSNWGVTSNRLWLQASASDDASGVAGVNFSLNYVDGTGPHKLTLPAAYDGNYWNYSADLTAIPDQTGITVVPRIVDGSANTFSGNGITFTLDRALPSGTVAGPTQTDDQNVTLTPSASDTGTSGLKQMAFSNKWIWQGENKPVTNNSGTPVSDSAALNGKAMLGKVGVNPAGTWYGPYTTALAAGRAYRAYFRMKTDNVSTASEVAAIDAVDNQGTEYLGLKRLRGTDFKTANAYQEFYVDLYPTGTVEGLEFRVNYRATASLWLDRVIVVAYPVTYASSASWTLTAGDGDKTVFAKFIDGAGNISPDAVIHILLGTQPTPTRTPTTTGTPAPTRTATATRTPTATPVLTPILFLPWIVK